MGDLIWLTQHQYVRILFYRQNKYQIDRFSWADAVRIRSGDKLDCVEAISSIPNVDFSLGFVHSYEVSSLSTQMLIYLQAIDNNHRRASIQQSDKNATNG